MQFRREKISFSHFFFFVNSNLNPNNVLTMLVKRVSRSSLCGKSLSYTKTFLFITLVYTEWHMLGEELMF